MRMLVMILLLTSLSATVEAQAQKLKAEEIIAKHLEAMGGAETLHSVSTRFSSGTVVATFKTPTTAQLGGKVVVASDGPKNVIAMMFENTQSNYPHEKIGYDGRDVSGSYVRPGIRSSLGDFLLGHRGIIKQGIFGGSLSQSWILLDPDRKIKIEAGGTKKIGERQAYQLKCYPGGSDLKITMYFDAETFQHLRTEYERSISAQMGSTPETSATQGAETHYKLTEDFSDFKKDGGLTLPHGYKISLEIVGRQGSFKANWDMALQPFQFNQKIDPATFDVDDSN
jgi:outer membrane lipoprotein-sorting protein